MLEIASNLENTFTIHKFAVLPPNYFNRNVKLSSSNFSGEFSSIELRSVIGESTILYIMYNNHIISHKEEVFAPSFVQ